MTDDDNRKIVIEIIGRYAGISSDKISPEARFKEDLKMSLGDECLTLMEIDREFDYIFAACPYNVDTIKTVADAIDHVNEAQRRRECEEDCAVNLMIRGESGLKTYHLQCDKSAAH